MADLKDNVQLYSILKDLSMHVNNHNDLGTIIGYTVVRALENFNTKTGSTEEKKFEETKKVYHSLEKTLNACKDDDPFNRICDLQVVVNPIFTDKSNKKYDSELLSTIIDSYNTRKFNYNDKLRRNGLKLLKKIESRGKKTGAYNILTNDYELLEECFLKK